MPKPTETTNDVTLSAARKPVKRRYMRVHYECIVEVDDGDFAAVQRAQDVLEELCETVTHKRSSISRRDEEA